MKIALVIFPLQPSHGSILQTFALYNFLKKEGHIITILERKPPLLKPKELLKRFAKLVIRRCITSYKGPIFYRGRFPSIKMKELTPFINNYLGTDLTTTYSKTETCNFAESNHFDAYIVGSDQTWRPKYVTDIFHYYLDFLPDSYKQKRIAYAPSFGTDQWEYNAEQTKICKSLLSKFTAVSTREKSGTFLCRKYFGIDAVHVLDPTFLLNKSDYLSLVNNPQNTEQYHKSLC